MEITISPKILKIIIVVLVSIIAIVLVQTFISNKKADADCEGEICQVTEVTEVEEEKITAEKIEVFHFHATQQCWSCITVGDFTEKSLKEVFSEELESGKIVFESINYELPENSELTQKYRASGSSVFVNLVYDGQDHISEDVTVWRLVNNEIQFRKYLEDKLEPYL